MSLTPQEISQLYGLRPQPTPEQIKRQNIARGAAGIADVASGFFGQRGAEGQIEELGAEQEALSQQFKDLSAPSLTDANTVAAATRNAAILGGVPQQQDNSAELAAAKMAMESGADPATIQRQLAAAQQAEQQAAGAQQQQAFQQGLGMAQTDAQNQFAQDRQNLMMDMDANAGALEAAQRESLMAQQQKGRGLQNLLSGAVGLYANRPQQPGDDTTTTDTTDTTTTDTTDTTTTDTTTGTTTPSGGYQFGQYSANAGTPLLGFGYTPGALQGNTSSLLNNHAEGGSVQKTPGEFDHDTNDMILMAQTQGGLVDTGIRQTGGEFVLNPEQAEGLEQAYDKVKSKKKPTYGDLMALYEAARFLDQPQFDDDYAA